ncbi:MAG: PQQ-binding-like beta-propeller repeat protein, partial [Verrucomicrobia bacterium]|nr:PQQ-binding-like beta-propeller repeat protein [Verrucomicrobiota bacterium]
MNKQRYFSLVALLAMGSLTHATEWPMFRGAPGLRGVSGDVLPDALKLLWTFDAKGPIKSSVAIANGIAVFGSDDYSVYALDAKTGGEKWAFKTSSAVEATPLILENH